MAAFHTQYLLSTYYLQVVVLGAGSGKVQKWLVYGFSSTGVNRLYTEASNLDLQKAR